MIDFDYMASVLLNEADVTKTIANIVNQDENFRKLNKKIKEKFPNNKDFPTSLDFYAYIQNNVFTRLNTAGPLEDDKVINNYIFVDYLLFVNELVSKGKNNISLNEADFTELANAHTQSFIAEFEQTNNDVKPDQTTQASGMLDVSTKDPNSVNIVVNYKPTSVQLKSFHISLVNKLTSGETLGKTALKNFIKNNFNLIEAITSVVNLQQKSKNELSISSTLGGAVRALTSRREENKEISNFLLHADMFAGGSDQGVNLKSLRNIAASKMTPFSLAAKGEIKAGLKAIKQDSGVNMRRQPPPAILTNTVNDITPKMFELASNIQILAKENKTTGERILKEFVRNISSQQERSPSAKAIIAFLIAQTNMLPQSPEKNKADLGGAFRSFATAAKGAALGA